MNTFTAPITTDVVATLADIIQKAIIALPYNPQDQLDTELARYFAYKTILQQVKPHVDRYEKVVKKQDSNQDVMSHNYSRCVTFGTARTQFDKALFIETVSKKYKIPKHVLVELAEDCKKQTAIPQSITVEYIGDIRNEPS